MQKISLRVFYGFSGVKTVANDRAASAPAEHTVPHHPITRKPKKRYPETYKVKFFSMQKEISYIRLKKRFPIKSLKISHTHNFSKYLSKRDKIDKIIQTLTPIGRLCFSPWYHLKNYAPYMLPFLQMNFRVIAV